MAERNDLLRQAIARLEAATIYDAAVERARGAALAPVKERPAAKAAAGTPPAKPTPAGAPPASRRTDERPTHAAAVRAALETLAPQHLTQGIVLSAILGPPASRRSRMGRWGR